MSGTDRVGSHRGYVAAPDPKSKLHSLVRLSRPFLGADLPWQSVARRSCPGCCLRHRRAAPARPGPDRARLYACRGWATSIVENSDAKSRASGDTRRSNELVECQSGPTRGRSPVPTKIVLRGSVESAQYAAGDYRNILQAAATVQSMSRKGNCWDNAPMESFFGTLKTELVHQGQYPDRDAARRDLFAYIEGYYNRQRRHSAIGYITPDQAEAQSA